MALAIIGERHDLMHRLGETAELMADLRAITIGAIFINIIAQMQHRVEPLALRDRVLGIVEPAGIELARYDRQHEILDGAARQGTEPTLG